MESRSLTSRIIYGAIVVLTALALLASTALLIDYLRPVPLFCDEGGGCNAIKHTSYAAWGGVPTPVFGIVGFLSMGILAMLRGDIVRFLHLVGASAAACFAGFLIYLQISLGHICPYCMIVDVSSLVLLPLVFLRLRGEIDGPMRPIGQGIVVAALVSAFVGPVLAHAFIKPKLPDVIAREIKKTPPGQVTVVDFADFECPFCRQTHEDFQPILAKYQGRLRIVRKQVPLDHIHPHAMTAARAACCGEQMGQGEAMADRLFSIDKEQLTPDGCTQLAKELGLDEARFRACMDDPKTQAKIDADKAEFKASGAHGLPTIWIGTQKIEGQQGPEALQVAVVRAVGE
ncbi:MAG TPA: thioredoxin domain-containing protein [Polyangiaceae bacterium]